MHYSVHYVAIQHHNASWYNIEFQSYEVTLGVLSLLRELIYIKNIIIHEPRHKLDDIYVIINYKPFHLENLGHRYTCLIFSLKVSSSDTIICTKSLSSSSTWYNKRAHASLKAIGFLRVMKFDKITF